MKIFKNILSEKLYNDTLEEFVNKLHTQTWQSSIVTWPNEVIEGITGSCLFSSVSDEISLRIQEEISNLFTIDYNQVKLQYCAWQPYSGLSVHDDFNHKLGATIYLNENWNPNYGGFFLWKDKNNPEEIYNAVCPTKNMMVVNDDHEQHLVTPVSPLSTDIRATIQLWFD